MTDVKTLTIDALMEWPRYDLAKEVLRLTAHADALDAARAAIPWDRVPGIPDVPVSQERYDALRAESERLQSALAEALAANGAMREALEHAKTCAVTSVPCAGCHAASAALENPTEAGRAWRERLVAEARKVALADVADRLDAESKRLRACGTENDIVIGHERAALLVRHADEGMLSPPAPSEPDCGTAADPFAAWPTVYTFALAMIAKLEQHKPKKGGREGWVNDDPLALMSRVEQEARELRDSLGLRANGAFAGDVLGEAVDVANMAMMVADAHGAGGLGLLCPVCGRDQSDHALNCPGRETALRGGFTQGRGANPCKCGGSGLVMVQRGPVIASPGPCPDCAPSAKPSGTGGAT